MSTPTEEIDFITSGPLRFARQVVACLKDVESNKVYPLFMGYNILGRADPAKITSTTVTVDSKEHTAQFLDFPNKAVHRRHAVIDVSGAENNPTFSLRCDHTLNSDKRYNGVFKSQSLEAWHHRESQLELVKLSPTSPETWYPLYVGNVIVLSGRLPLLLLRVQRKGDIADDNSHPGAEMLSSQHTEGITDVSDSDEPTPVASNMLPTLAATLVPEEFGPQGTVLAPAVDTLPRTDELERDHDSAHPLIDPTQVAVYEPSQSASAGGTAVKPVTTRSRLAPHSTTPARSRDNITFTRLMQDDLASQVGAYDGISQLASEGRPLEFSSPEPISAPAPQTPVRVSNNAPSLSSQESGPITTGRRHAAVRSNTLVPTSQESGDADIGPIVRSAIESAMKKHQGPASPEAKPSGSVALAQGRAAVELSETKSLKSPGSSGIAPPAGSATEVVITDKRRRKPRGALADDAADEELKPSAAKRPRTTPEDSADVTPPPPMAVGGAESDAGSMENLGKPTSASRTSKRREPTSAGRGEGKAQHVLLTGFEEPIRRKYKKALEKLGAVVNDTFTEDTDLVVAPHVLKTRNFLLACCRAKYIVSPAFIDASTASGKLVEPEGYEPSPPDDEHLSDIDFGDILRRRSALPTSPLRNHRFYVVPTTKAANDLMEVIAEAGGTVLESLESSKAGDIMIWDDLKAAPSAAGAKRQFFKDLQGAKARGVRCYSKLLALTAILRQGLSVKLKKQFEMEY